MFSLLNLSHGQAYATNLKDAVVSLHCKIRGERKGGFYPEGFYSLKAHSICFRFHLSCGIILKDTPDNRILECAGGCKADLIATGDNHLLLLKEFEGIGVARVADFLHIFRTEPA